LFVASHGSRIAVYQLDEHGELAHRTADYVIGEPSLYGRRNSPGFASRREGSIMSGFAYDNVHHRLFVRDRAVNAWQPDGRILVFDVHPDRMENGPEAIAVFGQPDFESRVGGGVGPRSIASLRGTVLDEKNQRLFLSDGDNNRILVWDVAPERLTETPDAMVVLGQTSFETKSKSSGPRGLNAPDSIYYDVTHDRLFVSDTGNHRVLVFDARPERLKSGMAAFAVLGQPDFDGAEPGIARDRLARPSHLAYGNTYQRLFVADRGNRRILVFDASPEKLLPGARATFSASRISTPAPGATI